MKAVILAGGLLVTGLPSGAMCFAIWRGWMERFIAEAEETPGDTDAEPEPPAADNES